MICKVSSLCTTAMVLCSSIRHQQGPLISQSHLRKSQKTLQTSIESPGWMCLIAFLRKPMGLLHGFYGNVGTCLKIYNSRLWNPNVPMSQSLLARNLRHRPLLAHSLKMAQSPSVHQMGWHPLWYEKFPARKPVVQMVRKSWPRGLLEQPRICWSVQWQIGRVFRICIQCAYF